MWNDNFSFQLRDYGRVDETERNEPSSKQDLKGLIAFNLEKGNQKREEKREKLIRMSLNSFRRRRRM